MTKQAKQLATLASLIQFLTGLGAIECYRIAFRVMDGL